jgi:hypothetical protein
MATEQQMLSLLANLTARYANSTYVQLCRLCWLLQSLSHRITAPIMEQCCP